MVAERDTPAWQWIRRPIPAWCASSAETNIKSEHDNTVICLNLNNLELPGLSQKRQERTFETFNYSNKCRTDKFKGLLKVLAQVLLVAVCDGEALVDEEARVIVVERQVGGHVQNVADVKALQQVEVLSVVLVPQVQEGQDGSQLCVLYVRGGGEGVR